MYKDKQKQREAQARSSKERQQRNKQFIQEYKENRGCFYCGENLHIVLEFHHTRDKEHDVSRLTNVGRNLELLKKEVDKCIVVCCKCHKLLHAGLL